MEGGLNLPVRGMVEIMKIMESNKKAKGQISHQMVRKRARKQGMVNNKEARNQNLPR